MRHNDLYFFMMDYLDGYFAEQQHEHAKKRPLIQLPPGITSPSVKEAIGKNVLRDAFRASVNVFYKTSESRDFTVLMDNIATAEVNCFLSMIGSSNDDDDEDDGIDYNGWYSSKRMPELLSTRIAGVLNPPREFTPEVCERLKSCSFEAMVGVALKKARFNSGYFLRSWLRLQKIIRRSSDLQATIMDMLRTKSGASVLSALRLEIEYVRKKRLYNPQDEYYTRYKETSKEEVTKH